jgi:hypothetical protein
MQLKVGMLVGIKMSNGKISEVKVREIRDQDILIQCRKGYSVKLWMKRSELVELQNK